MNKDEEYEYKLEQLYLLAKSIKKEKSINNLSLESLNWLMNQTVTTSNLEFFIKGFKFGVGV